MLSLLMLGFDKGRVLVSGFALKVVVAPKVGFLPQKSFRIVIPCADYYLPAAISELFCVTSLTTIPVSC